MLKSENQSSAQKASYGISVSAAFRPPDKHSSSKTWWIIEQLI
jgi:hypothetical protein